MPPLTGDETEIIKHVLVEDEGLQLKAYVDCCGKSWRHCSCKDKGKLTIGVGRNLEDLGISENEAYGLLYNDIKRITVELEKAFSWFKELNSPRRIVILSMAFNLGISKLREFKKMIKQIESGDFHSASQEMISSAWSIQVKARAVRLSVMMDKGQF